MAGINGVVRYRQMLVQFLDVHCAWPAGFSRMKRRLFSIFSVLSLLGFIAVVSLWVRSYWIADLWFEKTELPAQVVGYLKAGSAWGHVFYSTSLSPDSEYRRAHASEIRVSVFRYRPFASRGLYQLLMRETGFAGFWCERITKPHQAATISRIEVFVPYWAVAMPFAVLPAAWLLRWRRERRRRKRIRNGFCGACGYDLRANKERCPECGTPIRSAVERQTSRY